MRPVEEVVVLEVLERELEGAVRPHADELGIMGQELVVGVGVRRERHHLPLVGVRLEAEELGDRAVEQAQRVREAHLPGRGDVHAGGTPEEARLRLGSSVDHGQDRGSSNGLTK